jgi:hypothetical protein
MKHIKHYKIFESTSPNFPSTKEGVIEVCEKYKIKNYTINNDLSIDVDGNVIIGYTLLEYLPLRFNHVSGYFDCSGNRLKSLEGCPQTLDSGFYCTNNNLESLKDCTQTINGDFMCSNNKLTDLEYFPEVEGHIRIAENKVHYLVYTFINKADSFMIEDFIDYEIVRNRDTVMLDRLQTFIRDNDLEMPNLNKIKEHYKIIE